MMLKRALLAASLLVPVTARAAGPYSSSPFGLQSSSGGLTATQKTQLANALQSGNALSELTSSAAAARTNLGLGTAAQAATGTSSGQIPVLGAGGLLGDGVMPADVSGAVTKAGTALQPAGNLAGLASAATARVNLGAAALGANSDITSLSGLTGTIASLYNGMTTGQLANLYGNVAGGQLNGPGPSTDGVAINLIKTNWSTESGSNVGVSTAQTGETDGLYITVRQGGPKDKNGTTADASGELLDIGCTGEGFCNGIEDNLNQTPPGGPTANSIHGQMTDVGPGGDIGFLAQLQGKTNAVATGLLIDSQPITSGGTQTAAGANATWDHFIQAANINGTVLLDLGPTQNVFAEPLVLQPGGGIVSQGGGIDWTEGTSGKPILFRDGSIGIGGCQNITGSTASIGFLCNGSGATNDGLDLYGSGGNPTINLEAIGYPIFASFSPTAASIAAPLTTKAATFTGNTSFASGTTETHASAAAFNGGASFAAGTTVTNAATETHTGADSYSGTETHTGTETHSGSVTISGSGSLNMGGTGGVTGAWLFQNGTQIVVYGALGLNLKAGIAAATITIPASGTAPTGATQLPSGVDVVTSCGSTAPLQLPSEGGGGAAYVLILKNRSGNTCPIYPPSGGTIESGAANVPANIASGADLTLTGTSGAWYE